MKTHKLFKRDKFGRRLKPDAPGFRDRPWYFQLEFRKKRYPRSLETTDAVAAQASARRLARTMMDSVVRNEPRALEATKLRHTVPATVAQLLAVYAASNVDATPKTRRANAGALRLILASGGRDSVEPSNLPVTSLDASLVKTYFSNLKSQTSALPQTDAVRLKRSANSRMNQARALFAPKALAAYKDSACYHPCFDEFMSAFKLHKFARLPANNYNPPSDQTIADTLAAWQNLQDRDLFLAIGHELAFGLRKGEMGQAQWSWWSVRQGYPVLDGQAKVKNGSGLVQVRALDPFFTLISQRVQAHGWRGPSEISNPKSEISPDDYILTGNPTQRTDGIFRAVSEWLRKLGWKTEKTNHALRAWSGSQVAMKYGIYDAQTWLRHSTVKITEQNYSHFVRKFKPANLDDLPVKWAILNQPLTLRAVA